MNPQRPQIGQTSQSDEDLLENNEVVMDIVRRHWIGMAYILVSAFIGLFAVVAVAVLAMGDINNATSSDSFKLIAGLGVILLGVVGFMTLLIIYVYRRSQIILTDKSLVTIVQRGLFNRKVSRLSMSNVEDVSFEQKGLLPTIFNYGTLTVQTAGQEDNFIFPFCPRPNHYAEEMLEARQRYARLPAENK
jgi:uncharacterized membrane protein YdbT with pleckstrin-like domain